MVQFGVNKAIFIDRDGVINLDHGYVHDIDNFQFIDGVFSACKKLKELGYKLVIVTNQSGIARGYFSEETFQQLTEWMDWNFVDNGVELDGIYYCPHHNTAGLGDYLIDCDCRKPKSGMFISAAKFLKIDLSKSVMIGDSLSDMQAAESAGITQRLLVKTGKELTKQAIEKATSVLGSIKDVPEYLSR